MARNESAERTMQGYHSGNSPFSRSLSSTIGRAILVGCMLVGGFASWAEPVAVAQSKQGDSGSKAKQDSKPKPRPDARGGDEPVSPERSAEISAWLRAGDPGKLPAIIDGMKDSDSNLRRLIVEGVIRHFPERAFDALSSVLDSDNASQREAARFGVGMLRKDRRALDALLARVARGDVDRALLGGLRMWLQPVIAVASAHAFASPNEPRQNVDLEPFRATRDAFVELAGRRSAPSNATLHDGVWKIADHRVVARRTAAFVDSLDGDRANHWRRFFTANRHWAGRPELIDVGRLQYAFHMENHASTPLKTKTFEVFLTAELAQVLQYLHGISSMTRGVNLALPIDSLLLEPSRCEPRLEKDDADGWTVRYSVPPRRGLAVGMGSMNVSYWLARVNGISHGIVRVDKERAVPTHEKLYRDDQLLAELRYLDYTALGDGWVPERIEVRVERPSNFRDRTLVYELDFGVVDGRIWQFQSGRAEEVSVRTVDGQTSEQRTLRATASILGPTWVDVEAQPSGETKPSGSSGGESKPSTRPRGTSSDG